MYQGSHTWKITNNHSSQSIYKLMNASVGESFESDVFAIGNMQWQIVVYPNGWTMKNKNHLNVCIKLLSMPLKWRQLLVCRTIQCVETMSSCTSIASYYKSGDTMCWKEGTLLRSELLQITPPIKVITFKVSIDILKVICKKNKQILYPNVEDTDNNIYNEYKQQQYIIWKIDNQMLSKFRLSYHSKSFESKKYQNKMWCVRAYPNGMSVNDEGYLGLYLTLCSLPANISKIKVLYTFRCKELKSLKHARIKNFSYQDKSSWGVSRFFEFVQLHKVRSLTFYIDITIMNEYDENGKEILPSLKCSPNESFKYATSFKSLSAQQTKNKKDSVNSIPTETDEEKVNNLESFDSINCVLSSSMSSTLENRYRSRSYTNLSSINMGLNGLNLNAKNQSFPHSYQQSLHEIVSVMKKEINTEIEQLQKSYNIKLNSLCAIVEQIQVNNDMLSTQTREMTKTVNDVCTLMQKERKKMKNNKNREIEMIRSEMASIKDFVLHSNTSNHNNIHKKQPFSLQSNLSTKTRMTHSTAPLFEDDIKDEYCEINLENNEVVSWLRNSVKMPQYINNFITNGFDELDIIKELSINELDIIGIKKLGHKIKILQCIRKLIKNSNNDQVHIERIRNVDIKDTHKDIYLHMSGNNYRSNSWAEQIHPKRNLSVNYASVYHAPNRPSKRNLSADGIKKHLMHNKVRSNSMFNESNI